MTSSRPAVGGLPGGRRLGVTELDRPARSVPDLRAIAEELTCRHLKLSLGRPFTTPPTRWVGCCSRPGHIGGRVRGRPDQRADPGRTQGCPGGCAASSPNSLSARKRTGPPYVPVATGQSGSLVRLVLGQLAPAPCGRRRPDRHRHPRRRLSPAGASWDRPWDTNPVLPGPSVA
jgi:hypothetical protein